MELNKNCVRDTLLICEKILVLGQNLSFEEASLNDFCNEMPQYTKEAIAYTLILLTEADFIDSYQIASDDSISDIYVIRLTYSGHEFLDTIRSNAVWEKISSVAKSFGTISLPIIQSLGSHFLQSMLFSNNK